MSLQVKGLSVEVPNLAENPLLGKVIVIDGVQMKVTHVVPMGGTLYYIDLKPVVESQTCDIYYPVGEMNNLV